MIKIKIPATSANLGAGFDALGLAVNLYNHVYMEESEELVIQSLDDTIVPTDKSNLIYQSAKMLFDHCEKQMPNLHILQQNDIPMTRGLGSSSACIVAGLVGANHLMGEPLTTDEIVNLAARIEGHPDNTTPALLGGIVTSVYDEKKVSWVKQDVNNELDFFAIVPDYEIKTENARDALPKTIEFKAAVFNLSRAALFSSSLLQGKYENLRVASDDSLHHPYRLPLIHHGREIIDAAYDFGAYAAYISGSGPTIMVINGPDNYFFDLHMRETLNEFGLCGYDMLRLSIDNVGTQVYTDQ